MEKLRDINIKQLKQLAKKMKILCFGCGIQGKRMALILENWQCENNLKGYIDNDKKKIGKDIIIEERRYPIHSIEAAKRYLDSNTLLLITSLDYKSIYEQLLSMKDVGCLCVSIDEVAEIELLQSDYNCIIKESKEQLIPKKIHYAWLGNDKPYEIQKNIEHWKELCPDYQFFEWNEKNYDISKNLYMKQAYENKAWGFVPDYMRLDVVYKYGGIYLDTDIKMEKKPDDLLYQKCFGCVDTSLVMNLGSGFGAIPKMGIIKELRDYYDNISFIKKDGSIDNTPCTIHSYLVLKHYGVKINNELQNVYGMNIYPMIFQGACQHTRTKRVTEKTYWMHYGNMSWFNVRI